MGGRRDNSVSCGDCTAANSGVEWISKEKKDAGTYSRQGRWGFTATIVGSKVTGHPPWSSNGVPNAPFVLLYASFVDEYFEI